MKKFLVAAIFSFLVQTGFSQNTPGSVTLKMLSFTLPSYVNQTLVDQFALGEPQGLNYALNMTPLLGYAFSGDWFKLGAQGTLDAWMYYDISQLGGNNQNWFANQLLWMTAGHSIMYSSYDIYKKLRLAVPVSAYKESFTPVNTLDAFKAPFRGDYLADPSVSIGLGCVCLGGLMYYYFSGTKFTPPTGSTMTYYGNSYPINQGLALYWTESVYRNYWAGVAEEAYFRGYLLPELVEYTGPICGVGIDALLFTFAHYSVGDNIIPYLATYMPFSIYEGILSYQNHFDFQKSAFVHFWDDIFLQALALFAQNAVKFAVSGNSKSPTLAFSYSFSI